MTGPSSVGALNIVTFA